MSSLIKEIIGESDYKKIAEEKGKKTWMDALFTSEVSQSFSTVLTIIIDKRLQEGGGGKGGGEGEEGGGEGGEGGEESEGGGGAVGASNTGGGVFASAEQQKIIDQLVEKGIIDSGSIPLERKYLASPNSGLHDLLELLGQDIVIEYYKNYNTDATDILDEVLLGLVTKEERVPPKRKIAGKIAGKTY